MDRKAFDHLAVEVGTHPSRRAAIALLLAGTVTAGLSGRSVSAKKGKGGKKKKKKKKGCGPEERQCGDACISADACCTSADCPICEVKVCVNGSCGCANGNIEQNGVCGVFIDCKSTGEISTGTYGDDCCSGHALPDNAGNAICQPGAFRCLAHADCASGPCRGFMCPEFYNTLTHC